MAATVALYSSSPPSAVITGSARNTGNCDAELDFGRRSCNNQQNNRRIRGGLSSLFGSNGSNFGETYEVSVISSSASYCSPAQSDSTLISSRDSFDVRSSGAVNIPTVSSLRVKDRSPVSVLNGFNCSRNSSPPLSTVTWEGSTSGLPPLDSHNIALRRRPSLSAERPLVVGGSDKHFFLGERSASAVDCGGSVLQNFGFCVGNDGGMENFRGVSSATSDATGGGDTMAFPQSWRKKTASEVPVSSLGFDLLSRDSKMMEKDFGSLLKQSEGSEKNKLLENAREQLKRMVEKSTDTEPVILDDQQLLYEVQKKHSVFYDPLVKMAFNVASSAHQGQVRKDGKPYITHCLETAIILAECRLDKVVIAAGILHDILDDSMMDEPKLRNIFGDKVTDLVVGVSKLSMFSQMARDRQAVSNPQEASRLRHMFIAMVDVRVVLIKLADRLHNLRTLNHLPRVKQMRIAEETLEIFAPIANRLGIWRWKAEIEDICFKYLHPEAHMELSEKLGNGRWQEVKTASEKLHESLTSAGVDFHDLDGRPKNLYSVYLKMQRKGRSVDEIFDVRGLRLIMEDESSCYAALDVVHKLWKPVAGDHFKDYIKGSKANGYQSLHTVVQAENGQKVEVQIRTKEMHHQAEYGLAAHWQYKEGEGQQSSSIHQKVAWIRWVLSWHAEFLLDSKLGSSACGEKTGPPCPFPNHEQSCPYFDESEGGPLALSESDCDPVYIIVLEGDTMSVREVAKASSVADVIRERREIDPRYVNQIVRPLVNHEFVEDMNQNVRMGDVVELVLEADILEDMEACAPSVLPLHAVSDRQLGLGLGFAVDEMLVDFHRQKLNLNRKQLGGVWGSLAY